MKKMLVVYAAVWLTQAQALCINPFGCSPSNLDECRAEAAKLNTDRGVSVAIQDCHELFVARPERLRKAAEESAERKKLEQEQENAQRQKSAAAAKKRSTWLDINKNRTDKTTSAMFQVEMGQSPIRITAFDACIESMKKIVSTPLQCAWYSFASSLPPVLCKSASKPNGVWVEPVYIMFVTESGKVVGHRDDPVPVCD